MSKKKQPGAKVRCGIRRAFTLIELLVVVSVIALLVSILLPSLRMAREQARSVKCLAQLRAISTASHAYAAEDKQEQVIPVYPGFCTHPTRLGDYEWGGRAGIGEPTMGEDPSSSVWGTAAGRGPVPQTAEPRALQERACGLSERPRSQPVQLAGRRFDGPFRLSLPRRPGVYGSQSTAMEGLGPDVLRALRQQLRGQHVLELHR